MTMTWQARRLLTAIVATTPLMAACGGGSGSESPSESAAVSGTLATYTPFETANLTEQQAHVNAWERIRSIRGRADFAAADFGDVAAPSPTGGTIADIYVNSGLRDKVLASVQSHDYGAGAGTNAVGKAMDGLITKAIADGAEGKNARVQGQIIDKTLQRFFYESVMHKLNARNAMTYDEAFGHSGFDFAGDTAKAKGIAYTAYHRDEHFPTDFHGTIFREFLKGKVALDQRFAGTNPGRVDKGELPDLEAAMAEIDRQWLLVFAYSSGYEFADLAVNPNPPPILAEAAMYFNIVEDFMKTRDAEAAAYIRAQIDATPYDRATTIDTAGIAARINQTFGIDVTK